jgi:hypothetical protein
MERGKYGREMTGNFSDNGDFHAIVGMFYMLRICFTSTLKEGMLRIYSP